MNKMMKYVTLFLVLFMMFMPGIYSSNAVHAGELHLPASGPYTCPGVVIDHSGMCPSWLRKEKTWHCF